MRVLLLAAAAALLASCAHSSSASPQAPGAPAGATSPRAAPEVLRVDPSDPAAFRTLQEALAARSGPRRIQLASGLYQGPFRLTDGVELIGEGPTVLYVEEGPQVLTCEGAVSLEALTVQGGVTGIEAGGRTTLKEVTLSGQRQTGLKATGALVADRLDVTGTVSETVGVAVAPGARVELIRPFFRGALREAIKLEAGASAQVDQLTSEGPLTVIESSEAEVVLRGATVSGGRGPALFFTGGDVTLSDVTVFGHEYALLTGMKTRLTVTHFTSVRADRAGMAMVATRAQLSNVLVVDCGNYGGVQSLNSDLWLRQFVISGCKSYGVTVNDGKADIADGVISRIADASGSDGDALHLRRAQVRVSSVTVRGVDGAGVMAAESAEVAVRDLVIEQTGWGGLVADTGARLEAVSVFVRDTKGAAIAVPDRAIVRADLLRSAQNAQGDVWAECAQGAQVFLSRLRSEAPEGITSPCVAKWQTPRLFDPLAERR